MVAITSPDTVMNDAEVLADCYALTEAVQQLSRASALDGQRAALKNNPAGFMRTFEGDVLQRCLAASLEHSGLGPGPRVAIEFKTSELIATLLAESSHDPVEALLVKRLALTHQDMLVRDEIALSTPDMKSTRKAREDLRDRSARRFHQSVRALKSYRRKAMPLVQVVVTPNSLPGMAGAAIEVTEHPRGTNNHDGSRD